MPQSEEARKAASERMKAMHAAKRAAKEQTTPVEQPPIPEKPTEKVYSQDDYSKLENQIAEVMQLLKLQQSLGMTPQPQQNSAHIAGGRVVGMTDRYSVDPANYPNPVERLSKEGRLAPFAFDLNYEIEYEFQTTEYQTKEGIWQKEPRFQLQLARVVLDEDGVKTNGRYLISKAFFLEDPQSAITVARQNGFNVNDMNEKDFLDEMRYIGYRDWLIENFYPPRVFDKHSNKKELSLDGKVVQFFEITSQNSEALPFNQLDKKL